MKRRLSIALVAIVLLGHVFLSGCSALVNGISPDRPASNPRQDHDQTNFNDEYVTAHRGKVTIEIPEAYELANVVVAISKEGRSSPHRVQKEGDYYQRVLDHFMPFKDHPAVQAANFSDSQIVDYYAFRENAFGYAFDGDRLVYGGVYSTNFGQDLFSENLTRLEDFARQSGFRQFYADNAAYYAAQIESYCQKVTLEDMWAWLEGSFPYRHDAYKVVFSPLIRASHSTQTFFDNNFTEIVMFVAGPDLYASEGLDPAVEQGYLARVVFTEIDHNHVNPASRIFEDRIELAFSNVSLWNAQAEADLYYNPVSTFNEYMTWAVFALYAHDTYSPEVAKKVIARAVEVMEQGRGFSRFGEFTQALLELYVNRPPEQNVVDLYPGILEWAEQVEN